MVGVDYCEQMVGETNPAVLAKAQTTLAPHGALHGYRTIADIMRSLNPFTGAFYPNAARWPADARDVLSDGRPARPSVDALPGRGRDGAERAALQRLSRPPHEVRRVPEADRAAARRSLRLLLRGPPRIRGGRPPPHSSGLLGIVQRSGALRLHVSADEPTGAEGCSSRPASSSAASSSRPISSTSTSASNPARQLLLRRLAGSGRSSLQKTRRNPVDQPASVEQTTIPRPAKREPGNPAQVHLGDVAALARPAHRI